ncbi:hypothetical protein [Anaerolentibacter hominis]|uniref:hypothetical protein n=1 Tax=Anaerolentibacter hominis TaxID=3079009 RepID=UPI0031B83370
MEKYCIYCGKPLAEGEQCSCRQKDAPFPEPERPARGLLYRVWSSLTEILNAPVSGTKRYVVRGDLSASVILILLQALFSGSFMIIVFGRLEGIAVKAMSYLSSFFYSGYGQTPAGMDFPLLRIFFLTVLFSLLFSSMLTLLFFAAARLLKSKAGFVNMIHVTAVRSAVLLPVTVLAALFGMIHPLWGIVVFAAGYLLACCVLNVPLKAASGLSNDQLPYVVFICMAVVALAVLLCICFTYPLYLPDSLRNGLNVLKMYLNDPYSLFESLF